MTEALGNIVQDPFMSNRRAILTLLPYAVWRERGGDNRMVDAYLGVIRTQWGRDFVARPITTLFGNAGPDFPNRAMALLSPYVNWETVNTDVITRWASAASAVPYTEEVGQSVVDTLLQIASNARLQPHIPVDIWTWLKKLPSLPPGCWGRKWGTKDHVVRRVRELRDVEILESYFLLVWSEWNIIHSDGLGEMCTSIGKDLCGIGMRHHREVLIKRLDHVLGELDRGWKCLKQHGLELDEQDIYKARKQYGKLKKLLLEADREALEILTRTPFIYSFDLLTPADVH